MLFIDLDLSLVSLFRLLQNKPSLFDGLCIKDSLINYFKIIALDEIAPGHEVVDFGIWLRSDDHLKFTALDTVP